jgi:tellurite resistance protein
MEGKDEDGHALRGLEILMSGPTNFPRKGTAITVAIEVVDVTDRKDVHPVLRATGSDEAPSTPLVRILEDKSPFIAAIAQRAKLATIPLALLHAPHKGRRRLRIDVTIFATNRPERALSNGSTALRYVEDKEGYLALGGGLFTGDPEELIGLVGIAAAAIDGQLDDAELQVVTKFLAARAAAEGSPARREVGATLSEAARRIREGRAGGQEVLDDACRGLRTGPVLARQAALEVAVAVVTSDGRLTQEEGRLLLEVADHLALNTSALSARDDVELLHLFVGSDPRYAIGLPLGLDRADELVWLKRAWRTWSSRVPTYSDREQRRRAQDLVDLIDRLMEEREDA